ncbi:RNA polymerase III RPC4-domain-containing protein [Aspergillus granulosus]|uniref:RNA polymerase III RPC4-domain-containing protein n=1 Tax=Aspergillus granulosus TaxID=176169 RepID=A0ABR4HUU7_9EURO
MPPKAGSRRGAASAGARGNNAGESGSNLPSNAPTASASPAPTSSTSTPGTARAPVQRLQTLKKRTPSGSIGPGPSGRPTSVAPTPGEPAKPTLKYKPRAVGRRSKEEREAIEKLEAERHAERLAEAAAIQRGKANLAARGRAGFSGRGRGGMAGMGAAGPLGSGVAGRRGRGGSRFGTIDSRGTSMSRRSKSMTTGAGGAISSDESDSEIRVSIDRINLDSDADDDDEDAVLDYKKRMKQKGKMVLTGAGERGLRPIRVERHEHEERVVSVNMESSTTKSAELRQQAKDKNKEDNALFVQDDDDTPTETEPRVKDEPMDENDQRMAEVPHADEAATTDDGLLPAQKVKVRRKLGSREPSVPAVKDPKSLLRTKEDIEEYDRHAEDLEMIKDLFTKEPPAKKTNETTEEADTTAEAATEGEEKEEKEKKEEEEEEEEPADDKLSGQLFLMQFPPITPNLIIPSAGGNKDEEATETPNPATSQTAAQNEANGQPTNLGLKREDDFEVLDGTEDATTAGTSSKVVTAADWQLQAGRAGKLNVHASGRVTMDWGGISFELDRATAVDFLQEALIVSTPPNATEVVVDDEHKVWAMGQLSGKFTVMPDWEKML